MVGRTERGMTAPATARPDQAFTNETEAVL